jgi:hypothetical protein
MNTSWLKIASAAIGILIIIVLVTMYMPGGNNESAKQPAEPNGPTTFYDQAKKDRENFSVPEQTDTGNAASGSQNPNEIGIQTPALIEVQQVPAKPASKEITIYVKQPTDMEKIEAEKEINIAVPMFSIGRLPGPSYKTAIDAIRRILNRWPDSIYAYQAKRMLAKVPERDRNQYNVTPEEMNISMFSKPRAGTVPFPVPAEER